jgi:hypothetical protein
MAKDLESRVRDERKAHQEGTHITKISIEMLETVVIPVFKP